MTDNMGIFMNSTAIENFVQAQARAVKIRPRVGGFPYLAEVLRAAGVTRNLMHLPSCHGIFLTQYGDIVIQAAPLVQAMADIPVFDRARLIQALRIDQAGESTFEQFLSASWQSGVVRFEVDFVARQVVYYGCREESYVEEYPAVEV